MAQVIEKIVRSKYPPRDTRVIWLDSNDNTFKTFVNGEWVATSGSAQSSSMMIETTYAELKEARDNGKLTPGQQYRITDYECTTAQENTMSAGHPFDIIVVADDEKTLNENAKAIQHEGDTYFADCNLAAWELKYSINNDFNRFAWASEENGKGVIYYMKDEWGNECPYDFKNILYNGDWGLYDYAYTFNWANDESDCSCEDLSVAQFVHENDEGGYSHTYGNVIKPYGYKEGNEIHCGYPYRLNFVMFLNTERFYAGVFYGCYKNTFGNNCHDNTFGNNCYFNTFGNICYNNTFGDSCYLNTFGNICYNNNFREKCFKNTFGNNCYYNNFQYYCHSNTFGNLCCTNTFVNLCNDNTFGNNCSSNHGNNCSYKYLECNALADISGDTPEYWFNGEKK